MQTEKRNHLKIGRLPDLKIVSVETLMFHEEHDEGRLLTLMDRFGREGILRNPPIVGKTKDAQFPIILDGANRVTALTCLGIRHIPVQMVDFDDPRLVVSTWNHAVERFDEQYFTVRMQQLSNLEISEVRRGSPHSKSTIRSRLEKRPLCLFRFRTGRSVGVASPDGLPSQVDILKKITGIYVRASLSDRVSYTNLEQLKRNYPDFKTLLVFREFSKEEILALALSGNRLPAGITRIIVPKRVLGLNISLESLRSLLTLGEKNDRLYEMINKKIAEKSIRFYQESTFVFDE